MIARQCTNWVRELHPDRVVRGAGNEMMGKSPAAESQRANSGPDISPRLKSTMRHAALLVGAAL